MSKFKMKSKATQKAAKAATEVGGKLKRFKWDDNRLSAELLILAPISEDVGAVFTSKNHEYWIKGRPHIKAGTPSYTSNNGGEATGDDDKLINLGWKLRDKYQNSKNDKKKNFWKNCLPNTQNHCLVLDLKNVEAGPLLYTMPQSVADVVLEEIKDAGEDLTSICDFDEGRVLYIKSNGEKGKKRKYKIVKFKDEANLLTDGVITEDDLEEFAEKMYDLRKTQIPYSEEAFEKYYDFICEKAAKIGIDVEGLEEDEEEPEYEEDGEEYEEEEDLGVDEEDLNLEDDEEEIELEEEEEEEPEPPKNKKKKAKKKAASKKSSKKVAKKTSKKKVRRRR